MAVEFLISYIYQEEYESLFQSLYIEVFEKLNQSIRLQGWHDKLFNYQIRHRQRASL